MSLDDKKGGLRKEFTYNRRKKDGEEGPPQAQRGSLPKPLFIFAVKEKE